MRGATTDKGHNDKHKEFQPTRPLRGATFVTRCPSDRIKISTHAPLAGRDYGYPKSSLLHQYFNPRAPCGARHTARQSQCGQVIFQPTRPLRGATGERERATRKSDYFNPRAPCGARLTKDGKTFMTFYFNPRAPCGARLDAIAIRKSFRKFQPTRPLRGATLARKPQQEQLCISTHAPLAGRDSKSVQITMHIFAITDKFQMLLHRMPPVRAFCSFLMQENHADFGCEPPK